MRVQEPQKRRSRLGETSSSKTELKPDQPFFIRTPCAPYEVPCFCSVVRIGRSGRGWADTAHTTEDNQRNGEGPKSRQHYQGQEYSVGRTGPGPYFCL